MPFLKRLARLYVGVTAVGVAAIVLFFMESSVKKTIKSTIQDQQTNSFFLVDTPTCRIPDYDPFDKSVAELVNRTGSISCGQDSPLTYDDGDVLRINWDVVRRSYNGKLKFCKYCPISRGPEQSDFHFVYGENSKPFHKDIKIRDEFITVHCFNESEKKIYTNFHTFVLTNTSEDEQAGNLLKIHKEKNKPREVLNVMMIGVDSVSRLNSMRQMPLTRQYLLKELQAIEMLGYTKVADNTFVNIVPMTTGKFLEELPWNETLSKEPFDKYNFIWKNFSQSGYKTLYAEDAPKTGAFTFRKGGFKVPPVHHYNRALSLAMESETSLWSHEHHCVGNRLETNIVLNYAYQFSKTYRDQPHYGFTFISRLTHSNVNLAGAADEHYMKFLKTMHDQKLLENTVLVFFSDHGIRFGRLRNTYIGKFEERLPIMFFVFPRWFREKYPRVVRNMKINSRRLTTPFDIHETLKSILFFTGEAGKGSNSNRGISLFNEIPENRTCESAGILPHWCMCSDKEELPTASQTVNSSLTTILTRINKKLSKYSNVCEVLKLKEVTKAEKMITNSNVLRFKTSIHSVLNRTIYYGKRVKAFAMIQVTFSTVPGGALFEATVKHDERNGTYAMAGDISRINKYGDQSWCIDNFELKKFCYCKEKAS